MENAIDVFIAGLRNRSTGGVVTTVKELRENQFGFPLKHYAQQYLYGSTGIRIHSFNSIQGPKSVGKSVMLFDLMGDICGDVSEGGLGGISALYELEGKISPTILSSILYSHGERALVTCMPILGQTLESAMANLNKTVLPAYLEAFPKKDKPLLVGFDSIGGASSEDTIEKLQKEGSAGKGYTNKTHYMKYFCENQGMLFSRMDIPIVMFCINQEKDATVGIGPFARTEKTITGGKAQTFKDGHMLSISKKTLASGDGNIMYLKTVKTAFCDPRQLQVEFRWNKFGRKFEDCYEARLLWPLATAQFLAQPNIGVDDLRDICHVKLDKDLVTCKQLGLTKVTADEFEKALMADTKMLEQLYVLHKIEKLKGLDEFASYTKNVKKQDKEPKEKESAPVEVTEKPAKAKGRPKGRPKADKAKPTRKAPNLNGPLIDDDPPGTEDIDISIIGTAENSDDDNR